MLFRSEHDEMTGQSNRIRLSEALDATMNHAARSQQSAAFLIAAGRQQHGGHQQGVGLTSATRSSPRSVTC